MSGIRRHGTTCVLLVLVAMFCAFVFYWETHITLTERQHLEEHARVIEPSLWNLDPHASHEYLQLAAESSNYERLTVITEPDGDVFVDLWSPPAGRLDNLFISLRLIYRKHLSTPIYHKETVIGRLDVVRLHMAIYTYLYWFLVCCLLLFGGTYFLETLFTKQLLEVRVDERTNELRTSKERLRAIIHASSDAMIVLDCDGVVTLLNPAAETLFELDAPTAVGEPAEALLPDIFRTPEADDTNSYLSQKLGPSASGKPCELDIVRKNGVTATIEVSIARGGIADETFIVCMIRDISRRKEMEEMLRQSKRMDAIGQLAGGIAHDFNNMLGGIMGAAEMLEKYLCEDEKAHEFHQMIMNTAERASELTQQLLSFARKRPLVTDVLDLHRLIQTTVSLLTSTIDKRIEIPIHFYEQDIRVVGDASQLQSAFLNLGINAWHAMPEGGTLEITTNVVELDETYCRTNSFEIEPGEYVDIEFRDTGGGIPPEHLAHIFEPFFTTKEQGQGTGLGLSAVFGTVKQHHGTIWAYSEVGKGTTIHIILPRSQGDVKDKIETKEAMRGSGTILLVDDEPSVRATAKAMLEELGYTVLLAENGKEGVDIFKKFADSIDMVILDMIMPKMNGRDCFKAIREINPEAKVILVSGFTREDFLAELTTNGLCDFIRKPFSIKTLSYVVHKTIYDSVIDNSS